MDSAIVKKRMVRLSQGLHRRMNDDPRLTAIDKSLKTIERHLVDMKRDLAAAASPQPVDMEIADATG